MNTIESMLTESRDAAGFASRYLGYLSQLLERLDVSEIANVIFELQEARDNRKTIFIAGNGGSAATASHMANDISWGLVKRDLDNPFRALALNDNISVLTAVSNDDGYDDVFLQQLRVHYRPGDQLIVISASGNSENLIRAGKWVKERGGRVMGFVGFDGGAVKEFCDCLVQVKTPKGEYGPVEDVHMILVHLISAWLSFKST